MQGGQIPSTVIYPSPILPIHPARPIIIGLNLHSNVLSVGFNVVFLDLVHASIDKADCVAYFQKEPFMLEYLYTAVPSHHAGGYEHGIPIHKSKFYANTE